MEKGKWYGHKNVVDSRRIVICIGIAALLMSAGCGYDGPKVTVQELKAIVDDPDRDIAVIDVRPSILFKKGHVEGAMNYPIENFSRTSKELAAIKKDLAVICTTGKRSLEAIEQLEKQRIQASLVQGGMKEWQAFRYPQVTGD